MRANRSYQTPMSTLLVFLITLGALYIGWTIKADAENRTRVIERAGATIRVPATWIETKSDDETILISTWNPLNKNTRCTLESTATIEGNTLSFMASQRNLARGQALTGYRVVSQRPARMNGRDIYEIEFAYIKDERGEVPQIIRGIDYLFLGDGAEALVFSFEDDAEKFEASLPEFRLIAKTLVFDS